MILYVSDAFDIQADQDAMTRFDKAFGQYSRWNLLPVFSTPVHFARTMPKRSQKPSATTRTGLDDFLRRFSPTTLGGVLIAALIFSYGAIWWAGYIWDDEAMITANPVIVGPLGLREIWTTSRADICPLTLTTFWVEYRLWGNTPLPYHLVTLALHAGCALMLWRVLAALRIPGAWLGAAIWALHPVQVESVAWISETKNTESGLFFLLAVYHFVHSCEDKEGRGYGLAFVFSTLAMLAKSSTVILPVVFALCAWWVEGRWSWKRLPRLIPLAAMSLLMAAVSMWTQQLSGSESSPSARPWPVRLADAGHAVWFYLGKLIWPHPLITLYPSFGDNPPTLASFLPLLAVVLLLSLLWLLRRGVARPWFFAFVYFVTALLPVLGLVENTIFKYTPVLDHLQYLASMGPLALAGAGLEWLSRSIRAERYWLSPTLAITLLVLLAVTTWLQTWAYAFEELLWRYTIAWNPQSWGAHHMLGNVLVREVRPEDAIAEYRAGIALDPTVSTLHNNLATALAGEKRFDESESEMRRAVQLEPDNALFHQNLSKILQKRGKSDEALSEIREAVRLMPKMCEFHYNLGLTLLQAGQNDAALEELKTAVDLDPNDVQARNNYGAGLLHCDRAKEAIPQFEAALRINPADKIAAGNLAAAHKIEAGDK